MMSCFHLPAQRMHVCYVCSPMRAQRIASLTGVALCWCRLVQCEETRGDRAVLIRAAIRDSVSVSIFRKENARYLSK